MSKQYVAVTRNLDDETAIELPTNNDKDKTLALQTLVDEFPGAYRLKYKNPETNRFRVLPIDPTESNIRPPIDEDGWANKVFLVSIKQTEVLQISKAEIDKRLAELENKVAAQKSSVLAAGNDERLAELEKKVVALEDAQKSSVPTGSGAQSSAATSRTESPLTLEHLPEHDSDANCKKFGMYMRYMEVCTEDGPLKRGCVTVLSKQLCVTNTHVGVKLERDEYREKLKGIETKKKGKQRTVSSIDLHLDKDFQDWIAKKQRDLFGRKIKVYRLDGKSFVETTVCEVNFQHDFMIMISKKSKLLKDGESPPEVAYDVRAGHNYIALGLPWKDDAQHLSVLKGHINVASSPGRYYGAYGAEPGFSGGPVFRLGMDNRLIGIVVGRGTRMPAEHPEGSSSIEDLTHAVNRSSTRAALVHIIPISFINNLVFHDDSDA